jgi:hypothetical protein
MGVGGTLRRSRSLAMLALGAMMVALGGCSALTADDAKSDAGLATMESGPGGGQALTPGDAAGRSKLQEMATPGRPPALASLTGLTAPALRAALGEPALRYRDSGAELWQYAGSGCVLHVFLYQDNGAFRVSYAEVRVDKPELVHAPTCVSWLPNASAQMLTPTSAH